MFRWLRSLLLKMYVKFLLIFTHLIFSRATIVGLWYFGERHRFGPLHPLRPRPYYQTRAGRQTSQVRATVPAIAGKAGRRTAYPMPLSWRTQRKDPVDVEVFGRKPSTSSNSGHLPTACSALRPPKPRSAYPMPVYFLAGWWQQHYIAHILLAG